MDQTYSLESFLNHVQKRDPNQTEFAQAVREVMTTLWPFLEQNPKYRQMSLLERLVEPERVIQFRVVWVDDSNGTGQPCMACAVQLCHRPVQRRYALPSVS